MLIRLGDSYVNTDHILSIEPDLSEPERAASWVATETRSFPIEASVDEVAKFIAGAMGQARSYAGDGTPRDIRIPAFIPTHERST